MLCKIISGGRGIGVVEPSAKMFLKNENKLKLLVT